MFNFLSMMGTHEQRAVARYDVDGLFIHTCRVTDGLQPYETAVKHPDYNDGEMIIVEAYDDQQSAQAGHDRWKWR